MTSFGSNVGFVDELYARYLENPQSVSEAWQEYFSDYSGQGSNGAGVPAPPVQAPRTNGKAAVSADAEPATKTESKTASTHVATPLRGITASIAKNMVESLEVPTATSVRTIPVKLLEENRRVINQHQAVMANPKVSFTHLIAWALVRALARHPGMNTGYQLKDGTPHRVARPEINFGLAIDLEKKGERVLLVPNIKNAAILDFPGFLRAYNDLISRARANKLTLEDYQDTTVTLTNPGMIGTAMSVPRLMAGQSAIFGVGNIGFPAEFAGASPQVVSELGISKTMTVTSTYDHRVIQGAESGAFLLTVEQLLVGMHDFYEGIFEDLDIPHEPISWQPDRHTTLSGAGATTELIAKQASVLQLIRAHRVRGHLYAHLDPLEEYNPAPQAELELSTYGLTVWDLDRSFIGGGIAGRPGLLTLREILDILRETYCRHVGVEYMHIADPDIRAWLQERQERTRFADPLPTDVQLRILSKLGDAEAFERFLHTAYVGQKRFSIEGAETVIPMLDALFNRASDLGVKEAVIGMAHRGRLNVLSNIIGRSYEAIFRQFEGHIDPEMVQGSGDVKYHLGASGVHRTMTGDEVKVYLSSNPSHLEAVNPIVEGMVRARQDLAPPNTMGKFLPVLIHGDAAFAGQGVVAETLAMSQLAGYKTGGTIHLIINNQIGFTTAPKDAHSSLYCTDVAKTVGAPIFHVNGDYPEEAVRATQLAMEFRQKFGRDVVIDLVCYRRWGHNEGDDPSYTNPIMYAKIAEHRSPRKLYTEQLLRRGDIDMEQAEQALEAFQARLRGVHEGVREALKSAEAPKARADNESVEGFARPSGIDTTVTWECIDEVLTGMDRFPEGFSAHPKLLKQLEKRRERVETGKIDWALAEALAFGALTLEGTAVRLSGEDSGRGTFSQRHAKLSDTLTGVNYIPLAHLREGQAPFRVWDSLLSEFAVLGFEYGYSVQNPKALVMWEAQFGDFANGAQVIIDQFIASAEEKWNQKSGVVMLLPHGYEGQGPEHSSARIERYLQLSARGNIQVVYPSLPAQYFHMLRRQTRLPSPKPLIVFTPKSLLRLPACVSSKEDLMVRGFREILSDPRQPDPVKVQRLVLCSGKVYFDLDAEREAKGVANVALVRMEQLYPYPGWLVNEELARYPNAKEVVWCQEEPKNNGAWDFVALAEHLPTNLGAHRALIYVGRPPSPSPATGSHKQELREQEQLVRRALGLAE